MKAANIIETTCKIASNGYQLLSSAYNVGQKIGKIYYDTQVLGKDLDWGDVAGIGLDVFTGALAGKGISDDLKGFNKVRSAELSTAAADNGFMSGPEIGMDGNFQSSDGISSKIDLEGGVDNLTTKPKPYANSRPSYGEGQIEEVWNNAKDKVTGKVYDPTGVEITWDPSKARNGQWDMGHIPEAKYSEMHKLYMDGQITKQGFLEWYRDPKNYRPELPSTNRGHKYE